MVVESLLLATVATAALSAKSQADAAAESQGQARTEKRRVAFQKLQEDRKILRESSRERAAGIQAGANVGVSAKSSVIAGGAAATDTARGVGLGANAANFGFFNDIQNSKIREAGDLSRAATFDSASSIFGAGLTFQQNRLTQKARNA